MNRLIPIFEKASNEFYRFYFWETKEEGTINIVRNWNSSVPENYFDIAENSATCFGRYVPNNKILFIDLEQNIWDNNSTYNGEFKNKLELLFSNLKEEFGNKNLQLYGRLEKNREVFFSLLKNNLDDRQKYSPWTYNWLFHQCAHLLLFGNLMVFHSKVGKVHFQPFFDFSFHFQGMLTEISSIKHGYESNDTSESRNITLKNIVRFDVPSWSNFEGFSVIDYLKKVNLANLSTPINSSITQEILSNFEENGCFDFQKITTNDVNANFFSNNSKLSSKICNEFLFNQENDAPHKGILLFFKFICLLINTYDFYKKTTHAVNYSKENLEDKNIKIVNFINAMDESVFESNHDINIPSNSLLLYYLMNPDFEKERKAMQKEIREIEEDNLPYEYLEEQERLQQDAQDYENYWKNDGLDDMNSADPNWHWNID